MSPNTTFSLLAAAASLVVSVLSAVKGQPAVAVVFGLLVAGFLIRAGEGRRERASARAETEAQTPAPRRVKPARFKRR